MEKRELYHIHRLGHSDDEWIPGNEVIVSGDFESYMYQYLYEEHTLLKEHYGNYNIDEIISTMEDVKRSRDVFKEFNGDFEELLDRYYFLRREIAMEKGRQIFNPEAPSRVHALYLSDERNLKFWRRVVGDRDNKIFIMHCDGIFFESSDELFPYEQLSLEEQIEDSKDYWCPSLKKVRHKEILFQGKAKIKTF